MIQFVWIAFALLFAFFVAPTRSNAAALEKPAVVDGTAYAVIAPIFNDAAASQSYVRLFNGGAATSTFVVTVVGSPTGKTYGTANIQVPANASPQYKISLLLTLANAAALNGGDDAYALYLQSAEPKAGYQHVIYNAPTTLFQNASVCTSLINEVMGASSGRVLNNVHTSKLPTYPSTIYIHNYRNAAVTYRITIVDAGYADSTGALRAGSGAIIGSQDVVVGANTTYAKPFTFFETALGWTPSATQYHANVIVTNPSSGTSYDLVSQAISNQALGGELNMSTTCAINPPVAAAATATTTFAGTIADTSGQSGTLTVTVQAALAAASAPLLTAQSTMEKAQAVSQATGTLVITGGSTVSLTGTYDSATAAVVLSGGGYAFTGNVASGVYSGSYTAPNNATGGFSALNATAAPVTRYCGTSGGGPFNMEVSASGALSGEASDSTGAVTLTGQVTGSSVSGSSSEGQTFTGTILNGTISGTHTTKDTPPGTKSFSGTTCS